MVIWNLILILLGVCLLMLGLAVVFRSGGSRVYNANDIYFATQALRALQKAQHSYQHSNQHSDQHDGGVGGKETEESIGEQNIPEVDFDYILRRADDVQIMGLKMEKIEGYDDMRFPNYPPATLKALYEAGFPIRSVETRIPPGLYDRLYYWYPSFYASGWSFWLRPMNRYGTQPFWVRNNGNYYYIRN